MRAAPHKPTVAAEPSAVEIVGLSKFYGNSRGVEGLSFNVEGGTVFGFLGPNGAGKTTTIRLLLDLIRPSAGEARVLGHDVNRESLAVRRLCGYLPGDLHLPERERAGNLLSHLSRLRGQSCEREIEELSDRLGLDLRRRIGDLSKGNRQKVGIVAAFMHDPQLLILDEPTSGLDPLRQRDVQALIAERASAGRTVFLSSHALEQVEHVAEKVGIIREGRLVAVEQVSALRQRALRRVEVRFAGGVPAGLDRIHGVSNLTVEGSLVRMDIEGSMDSLIKAVAIHEVRTLSSERPELDEIFLAYYGETDGA